MDRIDAPAKGDALQALRLQEAARIKEALYRKGLTLADIDRSYRLPSGTARNTLREPHAAGERAIAAALASKPELLWRSRYHAGGRRKSRLDYSRLPTMAQRRNGTEG